ncbi:hypothetical protein N7533_010047 [Penicillium manginii]|uniref:uncharacterized protein n=1 Tax=Penicillium manginii TaxID=203109 RepID=UPI0025491967|nr:uncharacterized protein N7533_010047 [Penicillium manginii]KAJ5742945.1 hypothetical protein N7533_010047 [Penicillium manginii]
MLVLTSHSYFDSQVLIVRPFAYLTRGLVNLTWNMNMPSRSKTPHSAMPGNKSNTKIPERTTLLRDLAKAMGKEKISTSLWASLQVCDLSKLDSLIELVCISPKTTIDFLNTCPDLPKKWLEDRSVLQSIASGASSASRDSLSKCMRIVARNRDGHRCVLTGTGKVYQPVWIFPDILARPAFDFDVQSLGLWRFIDLFWEPARVQRWRNAVFHNPDNALNATSGCSSLICLRSDLAYAFSVGMFALRPVRLSNDRRELEVEFHWLPREKHRFKDAVDIRKQPLPYESLDSVEGLRFCAMGSNEPVKSGHRFTLTTDDPVKRPLPDFDLLDMAWYLLRIVAMSSAIELVCYEPGLELKVQSDDDKTVRDASPSRRTLSTFDTNLRVAEWLASGSGGR